MQAVNAPIWDFIERCGRAASIDEVETAFMNETTRLGFAHVALISHVQPLGPPRADAVALLRYPKIWLDYYVAEDLGRVDPVIVFANRHRRPFHWNDPRFLAGLDRRQDLMLNEARDVGIADGLTIPILSAGAHPAACSLVDGPGGVDPALLFQAHMAAHAAHDAALRVLLAQAQRDWRPVLSRRERECLTLAAQGKTDWAISEILGIAERTVHHAIERAKRRFGVASRVQAVVRALHLGEISFEEAIDWRARR